MTKIEADIARLEAKADALAHLRELLCDVIDDIDVILSDLKDRVGMSGQGMLEVDKDTPESK